MSRADARFCATCGAALSPGRGAERRQLTVLFADIVRSSALAERLGADDWRELLAAYKLVCRDAIVANLGHVAQFLGDGVMAYFGYPIAHEQSAVQAVEAALRIQQGIQHMNAGVGRRLGARIQVRIGIHTGSAVVCESGPGRQHELLAVGETPHIAARAQDLAAPDTVVLSGATAGLVHGFVETEPLGLQSLRGFAQPVELVRAIRLTRARTRLQAEAPSGLTPFAGRERELAELAGYWAEVREGASRTVLVRGEAGIGKSRMVRQFLETRVDDSATRIEFFCSPLTQASPLAPVIEYLDTLMAKLAGSDALPAKVEALRTRLGAYSRLPPEAVPLAAALLSYPGVDEMAIADLSPVRRRTRTLEVLRQWIRLSAERVPMVLFFDDVHWADPSTLGFIDQLVADSEGRRRLLCLTARPEAHVTLQGDEVRRIEMSGLARAESVAMLHSLRGGARLPDPVVSQVAERSGGVPLYIEEIGKSVIDSAEEGRPSPCYLADPAAPGTGPLLGRCATCTASTCSVKESLLARFDNLDGARSLAQLAAALGRHFTVAQLRAVAGLGDEALAAQLEQLCETELLVPRANGPEKSYEFKHALVQDAIYATLAKRERRELHEQILTRLRAHLPELLAAHPELGAHHAEVAELRADALRYLRDAGLQALGRVAVAEATRHLGHALRLLDALEEPERTAMEIQLQSAIMPAYMAHLGWGSYETERSATRLRDLALAQGDAVQAYGAMWGLWTVLFVRGDMAAALEAARPVFRVAMASGDPMLKITAYHALGFTHFFRGEFAAAYRLGTEGMALYEPAQERQIAAAFQLASSAVNCGSRTFSAWHLGKLDQVDRMRAEWHELVQQVNHAPTSSLCWGLEGVLLHLMRDAAGLRALALKLRALAETEEHLMWAAISHIFEAWADAQEGRTAAAVERMKFGISKWLATKAGIAMCDITVMETEVLLAAGRVEEALDAIQRGRDICERAERFSEPELHRLEAEILADLGKRAESRAAFRQALTSARSRGSRTLELRAALSQHRLFGDASSHADLQRAHDQFTEGFAQPELREASALLSLSLEAG